MIPGVNIIGRKVSGASVRDPYHPGKGAKPDCVIQLTMGKCGPMQAAKQPEHG